MLQVQMQMEADQQLAALQQQSHPFNPQGCANRSMGAGHAFHGHHSNGSIGVGAEHDAANMMSQGGSPMDDSPPNQARVSGMLLSLTALRRSLHGSASCHGKSLTWAFCGQSLSRSLIH